VGRIRRSQASLRGSLFGVVATLLVLVAASTTTAQRSNLPPRIGPPPPPDRELKPPPKHLDRLEAWIVAVGRHRLGQNDGDTRDIGRWPLSDLQGLWIDITSLAKVMRNPRAGDFSVAAADGRAAHIAYTGAEIRRFRVLACVAAGDADASTPATPPDRECIATMTDADLTPDLRSAARLFAAERVRRGDDNAILLRGAVLHADIAMLEPPVPAPLGSTLLPVAPRRVVFELLDGRPVSMTLSGVHWALAETALRFVKPANEEKPAPERDSVVRAWYQATTTWMQSQVQYDAEHLAEGRRLFPDDPTLLFLSGCEHEAYAAPFIQAGILGFSRSLQPPGSSASERRRAESFFRRALARRSHFAEARLHLGRVLAQLERPLEASREIRAALAGLEETPLLYHARLFLGEAEEQAGRFTEARESYELARTIAPDAQAPLLALSQLARRRDDYDAALKTMAALFEQRRSAGEPDPWQSYLNCQTRGSDDLIATVWQSIEGTR